MTLPETDKVEKLREKATQENEQGQKLHTPDKGNVEAEPLQNQPKQYPLTKAQLGIWLGQTMSPGNPSYNVGEYLEIFGPVKPKIFEQALQQVVRETETLHLRMIETEEGPRQILNQEHDWKMTYLEMDAEPSPLKSAESWMVADMAKFVPMDETLFGFALIKIAANHFLFYQRYHHIHADGVTFYLVGKRTAQKYTALAQNKLEPSDEGGSLFDLLQSEADYLASDQYQVDAEYWREKLADRPSPATISGEPVSISQDFYRNTEPLSRTQFEELCGWGPGWKTAPVMLAAGAFYLNRMSGMTDLMIGMVFARRPNPEIREIPGMASGVLPIRLQVDDQAPFGALVSQAAEQLRSISKHQRYTEMDMRKSLGLALTDDAFYGMIVNVMPFKYAFTFDGHQVRQKNIGNWVVADLQLALYAPGTHTGMSVQALANQEHFVESEVVAHHHRFLGVFPHLLAAGKETPLAEINLLAAEERHKLLIEWNQTDAPYAIGVSMHGLFEAQVERTPDRTAVFFEEEGVGLTKYSYQELNNKANQLAHVIQASYQDAHGHPLPPETLIALYIERSLEMVTSILAVLKAGGTYAPILPHFPKARSQYILGDLATPMVLIQTQYRDDLTEMYQERGPLPILLHVDQPQLIANAPTDNHPDVASNRRAYINYTSGTTGNPKGVEVEHQGVANLAEAQAKLPGVEHCRRSLCFTEYVFDVNVLELFAGLYQGHEIYVCNRAERNDIKSLEQAIIRHKLEVCSLPPTVLAVFGEAAHETLKVVLSVGETPVLKILEIIAQKANIFNGYGPTEVTVGATIHLFKMGDLATVIGRPLINTRIYVLSPQGHPVPIGAPGELCIGGAAVARGYLNRPEQTQASFIENRFATEEDKRLGYTRLYKTGDLVRYQPNGNLEFLGRNDHQVKIRGHRIELGEIEAVIASRESVKQAVVIALKRGNIKVLAAYVVRKPGAELVKAELRDHLVKTLPKYMIPESITEIDVVPLTLNDKIDTKALPEPERDEEETYRAPRTALEAELCAIWEQVLGLERVGIEDHFFRIGGDSIVSIQLVAKMRQSGKQVAVKNIFEAPTVAELAQIIRSEQERVAINAEQGPLEGSFPLLPIQQWFFDQAFEQAHHVNQAIIVSLPEEITTEAVEQALNALTAQHDTLRITIEQTATGYQQKYLQVASCKLQESSSSKLAQLQTLDVRTLDAAGLRDRLTQWQSDFDYHNGPLWRAAHLTGYEDGKARLFMAYHHLIMDSVSWRIIATDLEQHLTGQALGEKSSSYRQWVQAVQTYADNHPQEKAYWEGVTSGADPGQATGKVENHKITLSTEETQALLKAGDGYHTQINDLLLSALAVALSEHLGKRKHHIILEGHGREAIDESLDLTRTVGWFTTLYPVALTAEDELENTIIETKENLRAIPNQGIGYGALRQQGQLEGAYPTISYNYLGQLGKTKETGNWQIMNEELGITIGTGNTDRLQININGATHGGAMEFTATTQLPDGDGQRFADAYKAALQAVTRVAQAAAQAGGTHTPSDYGVTGMTYSRLQAMQAHYDIEAIYPANSLQQGFIYHHLKHATDDAYRVQVMLDYATSLDTAVYQEAWRLASQRYPVIRTAFDWEDGLIQIITKGASISERNFAVYDLSTQTEAEREASIDTIQQQDRARPFDLSKPGLVRITLIKQGPDLTTVIQTNHHSIADGWSGPQLLQTLHHTYNELKQGRTPQIEVDTAYLKAQAYNAKHAERIKAHWQEAKAQYEHANDINALLSEAIDLTQTKPLDHPNTSTLTVSGDTYRQLKAQCREQGVTLNVMAQFSWHKLLHTYTLDTQTIVGTTVSGREIPVEGIESSVGLYINTLPLAVNWRDEAQISEILGEIHQSMAHLNSYSAIPLASLQREGARLFHSLFVYENYPTTEQAQPDPSETTARIEQTVHIRKYIEKVDYPLSITADEEGETLRMALNYDEESMTTGQAQKVLDQLEKILSAVADEPAQNHHAIELLSEEERHQQLSEWNQIDEPYRQGETLHGLFEAQAEKTPDHIALYYEGRSTEPTQLSYRELNQKANQLAHVIRTSYQGRHGHPLPPETYIALYLDRSLEMVTSIIAVLKAGAAYVPIAPEYPKARAQFVLKDTAAPLVLTQSQHAQKIERWAREQKGTAIVLNTEQNERIENAPTGNITLSQTAELAYLIYTSGTTGQPKGVMQLHGNVTRLLAATQGQFQFNDKDVWTLYHAYTFDFAVWEVWGPLTTGGSLVVPTQTSIHSPQDFVEICERQQVTVLNQTPGAFYGFAEAAIENENDLPHLRLVIFGGDKLNYGQLKPWWKRYGDVQPKLVNMYGITETTVHVTRKELNSRMGGESRTIGHVLKHMRAYVLSPQGKLQPTGAPGELHVGGASLARGYLNQPELTQARFIENLNANEEDKRKGYTRLYKTGDLVRYQADGNLEYLGRNDDQVKIRGYRIELGEIEAALGTIATVKQAIVVDYEQAGHKILAAYVIRKPGATLDETELRDQLINILPDYMVPASIVEIETVPLTHNGKLDRKALPAPVEVEEGTYRAPRTELEAELCDHWQAVLGLERVGIEDHFFRLGGDSIVSIQLASRLRRSGIQIQVKTIFEAPTVAQLAQAIQSEQERQAISAEQGPLEGAFLLLPIQQAFLEQAYEQPHHWNQAFIVNLPGNITTEAIAQALNHLNAQHDAMRLTFEKTPEGVQVARYQLQDASSKFQTAELQTLDVRTVDAAGLRDQLTRWQSDFDYHHGPLWRAAHLTGYQDGTARLFMAYHHLIIDTVSWRIIATDLEQLLTGHALGEKGSSYRQWVQAVQAYPQNHPQEKAYWEGVTRDAEPSPPIGTTQHHAFTLTTQETQALLTAGKGYNTEINDLLLSALAHALSEHFGKKKNHITLEGHGRETIDESLDLTRTVGWFTTQYPVALTAEDEYENTIIQTKENLRAIPNHGIGYGAFSQQGQLAGATPTISYNYLGQLGKAKETASWQIMDEELGEIVGPENRSPYQLNINGAIHGGSLSFSLFTRLPDQDGQRFADSYKAALQAVIQTAQAAAQAGGTHTPSDYGVSGLSHARLKALRASYDIEAIYPANSLQQGFIYHHIKHPQDESYRVQVLLDYDTDLDTAAYQQAWQTATLCYPILRTAFDWEEDLIQITTRGTSLPESSFIYHDISAQTETEREASIDSIQQQDRKHPFELTKPGLMRIIIIKQRDDLYTVIKSEHHIIADGWSGPLLLQTVHQHYNALKQGQKLQVKEDTAYPKAQAYNVKNAEKVKLAWHQVKAHFEHTNNINAMLSHNIDLTQINPLTNPSTYSHSIAAETTRQLKERGREQGVTLNVIAQFGWHKLIHTYTSDPQTIVGTTVSGREIPVVGVETSVGLYINTLPLAVNWQEEAQIGEVLSDIHQSMAHLNSNSGISLASLQHAGTPLFHSLFVYENYPKPGREPRKPGEPVTRIEHTISFRKAVERIDYPLSVGAYEAEGRLHLALHYDEASMTTAQAQRVMDQLDKILTAVATNPAQPHHAIEFLSEAERHQQMIEWNRTNAPYALGATMHGLFEAQVERTPDRIALRFEAPHGLTQLTYRELNDQANQLAYVIRGSYRYTHGHPLPPETLIALYLERSLEMVTSILAVLKAGGTYAPILPHFPKARTQYILSDLATPLILIQSQYRDAIIEMYEDSGPLPILLAADHTELYSDAPTGNHPPVDSKRRAYINYTSGTTGKPKGVMVEHQGVANLAEAQAMLPGVESCRRSLSFTEYVFDVNVLELFAGMYQGHEIYICNREERNDISALEKAIIRHKLEVCSLPPTVLAVFGEQAHETLKVVLSVGETPVLKILELIAKKANIFNGYGPTEVTVGATIHLFKSGDLATNIGRPLINTRIYILSPQGKLVPTGAPGELCIGGAAVARGYLNRPEQTQASFIENHYATEEDKRLGYTRLYKTGDLVRYLPQGNLEFLGRNDHQVKIRGYRIELGEIEVVLASRESVKQAVVIALKRGNLKYLSAYVVRQPGTELDKAELREHLVKTLPEYMVPASITEIEEVPLTLNDKIDTKALPVPERDETEIYQPPRTKLESELCTVWQQVLGLERVGIEDNFYQIGGDSITAIKLTAASRRVLQMELPLKLLFEQQTIAGIATHLKPENANTIPHLAREHYPLSFAQERMHFIEGFEQGTAAYHIPYVVRLTEQANLAVLEAAINQVVERHPVLNTRYGTDERGQAYQQKLEQPLTIQTHRQADDEWQAAAQQQIAQPFDLTQQASLQLHHYHSPSTQHLLLLWHHIAVDGWSIQIFIRELEQAYQAKTQNQTATLPQLEISYGDYAQWQREHLQGTVLEQLQGYWQDQLAEFETLNLATDKPRPTKQTYDGNNYKFTLKAATVQKLRAMAQEQGTTLYTVLLGGFYVTLASLTGQTDLLIGTPSANRHHAQTQTLIGLFVNTLVLRAQLEMESDQHTLIQHVHQVITQAKLHQELPFERLIDLLDVARDLSRHPLYQVMFSMEAATQTATQIEASTLPFAAPEITAPITSPAKFDISLTLVEGEEIKGDLNYATRLYRPETIQRMAENYRRVLEGIVGQTRPIGSINLLSAAERHQQLHEWNQTDAPTPQNETMHGSFEAQVEQTPDRIALYYEDPDTGPAQYTYRELNQKANQLAHVIRTNYQEKHGQPLPVETKIALHLERSLEMVTSILAVLKTGAAYVPIAPENPTARKQYILNDTAAPILLTQSRHDTSQAGWSGAAIQLAVDNEELTLNAPNQNYKTECGATNLAYVIYTSGTTGQPKGVLVEHRAVLNTLTSLSAVYQYTDEARKTGCFSHYIFDVSVSEMFNSLCFGGELHLFSNEVRKNTELLQEYIEKNQLNYLFVPPAVLGNLAKQDYPSLRAIIFAGERCEQESCVYWAQQYPLYNYYGPTEGVIYATGKRAEEHNLNEIGRPVNNGRVYVLNPTLEPVPIGAPGELHLGGASLARGYLNQPEQTKARFIENPYASEADQRKGYTRLYKTGDIVRYRANGNLEYLGRNDSQIKIRGYRIELGEIEAALAGLDSLKQAVVVAHDRGTLKMLAAYVVAQPEATVTEAGLRDQLTSTLPDYMVPTSITEIEAVPLTHNGKLDTKALPAPGRAEAEQYRAPRTAQEAELCALWQQVLGIERVGIEDHFFRIGGDSIVSIQLVARMRRSGIQIHVKTLFEAPTIAQLSQVIRSEQERVAIRAEQGPLEGTFTLHPIQQWFFNQPYEQPHHWNQAFIVSLPGDITTEQVKQALDAIIAQHDALRITFEKTPTGYRQRYMQVARCKIQDTSSELGAAAQLQTLDVRTVSEAGYHEQLSQWQSDFDYHRGPLWRAAHLTGYEDGTARLFMAYHHLIIDTVSWRIIATDLEQSLTGQALEEKSSSYRQMVHAVQAYAQNHIQEATYWEAVMQGADTSPATGEQQQHQISLTSEQTQNLLTQASKGFNTQINDLLLSALAQALSEHFGRKKNHITLEGHGRETIDESLDLTRTVGWFTTQYPVALNTEEELENTIIHTKENLRAVPNRGIGYGALCQQGQLQSTLPAINFNYLGQIGKANESASGSTWQIMSEGLGTMIGPGNTDALKLNINGITHGGSMGFNIISRLPSGEGQRFAQAFKASLLAVTEEAQAAAHAGGKHTPSDFGVRAMTYPRLKALQARYDIAAIYLANSQQQSYIERHIMAPEEEEHSQRQLDYATNLDRAVYQQAWSIASRCYPTLRAAFVWEDKHYQIITPGTSIDESNITSHDLSAQTEAERAASIETIQQRDSAQPFDLTKPGLIRITLIKQREDLTTALISIHPGIADERSIQLLQQTVHDLYNALKQGRTPQENVDTAYLKAQAYNDEHAKEEEVRQPYGLANNINPLLTKSIYLPDAKPQDNPRTSTRIIDRAITQQLRANSEEQGMALTEAVHFSWHKLIHTYTLDTQTIVGTTISGRDIPIQGIETSVGQYMSIQPMVVTWQEEAKISEILTDIHQGLSRLKSTSATTLDSQNRAGARHYHSHIDTEYIPPVEQEPPSQGEEATSIEQTVRTRAITEKRACLLALTANEQDETLSLTLKYEEAWMTTAQAQRLLSQLEMILKAVSTDPARPHYSIEHHSDAERHQQLHEWNDAKRKNAQDHYILNPQRKIVPIGALGELYISMEGQYKRRPDLAELGNLENPFASERNKGTTHITNTGEIARYHPDGRLEIVRSTKDRERIGDLRVEIKAVEEALLTQETVKQAVVLAQEGEDQKILVAYVVSQPGKTVEEAKLRMQLKRTIPSYMVPASITEIEAVPRTITGQLDPKALPEPDEPTERYIAPQTELEAELCSQWQQELGIGQVGIDDHYYRIGGDTTTAARLIAWINRQYDQNLTVESMEAQPNIRAQAKQIERGQDRNRILQWLTPSEGKKPRLFLVHPGCGDCSAYSKLVPHLEDLFECVGVDNHNLISKDGIGSLSAIAEHYLEIIKEKCTHTETISLLGWSLGGTIALEMAAQLEQKGQRNIDVYLLDTLNRMEYLQNTTEAQLQAHIESQRKLLKEQGHEREHIEKIVTTIKHEFAFTITPLSERLTNTKITLLKAGKKAASMEELAGYTAATESPDNHIAALTRGEVKVNKLEDHDHQTIIGATEELRQAIFDNRK